MGRLRAVWSLHVVGVSCDGENLCKVRELHDVEDEVGELYGVGEALEEAQEGEWIVERKTS